MGVDREPAAVVRYAFHATLHPRPPDAVPGPQHHDAWGEWPTLARPPGAPLDCFPVGFEAALSGLGVVPRLFVEPDGALVWTGGVPPAAWQVDGTLCERNGRLAACELKGSCPPQAFDLLLGACGWPGVPVMVELVRAGVYLDEQTFRRHAQARGTAGDGQTLRPA